MQKILQAKHVSDYEFLTVVDCLGDDSAIRLGMGTYKWAARWDVDEALPQYPSKVLLAKARSCRKRGLLTGCCCGCRGDWSLTAEGQELLALAQNVGGA